MAGPIGIIANPASGKDIRRLVAHASVFDNQEKRNIVRRAVFGAVAVGSEDFFYMPDRHAIVEMAIDGLAAAATFTAVETPETSSTLDTVRAAARMRDAGCAVVITLGGDGTNRAVARGWQDAPLVAISSGTNNVFPRMIEATVAGAAAALVATGRLPLEDAARRSKLVHVQIEDEPGDIALIDAVLLDEPFVGSRAVWDARRLRTMVLARAEPGVVGLSSVGGLLQPVGEGDEGGLAVVCGEGGMAVSAPIAPGLYADVPVAGLRRLAADEVFEMRGPGVLAFDGERERRLKPGQLARLAVCRDGPWAIDVAMAMRQASCRGLFREDGRGD
jgi:hypothetical protein